MVGDFIRGNIRGTVVNIACGIDTRAYRLKTQSPIRWYNLDLPGTIEVRHRFLIEDGRISMIAKSAYEAEPDVPFTIRCVWEVGYCFEIN